MKIFNLQTNQIFDIEFKYSGENRMPCPSCSDQRRKKKDPCFSFNQNEGIGFCHHCDSRYVEYKPHEEKEYKIPVWENYTDLDDNQVKWFSKRMISQNTLIKMKVSKKVEWMPQEQKEMNTIAFPHYRNGEVVNVQYRDGKKNFKLEQGAELIWYNYDELLNNKEIIIVEGHIDCLSFIEEGIENVISVPNGASVGKMEYLDSTIDLFNDIEKVYIAVDVDEKGIKLRDELIRRIGAEKCFICNFSEFKDANEYLCHKGRESLLNVLKNAKQVDVEGIVSLPTKLPDIELLFKEGMQKGATIFQSEVDNYISWELGRLATFTGTPSCFTGERLIHTNLGVKKISELNLDDLVLSYNHDKKVNEYRRVIDKSSNKNKSGKLFRIKMKDGSVIKVTGDHRFFTGTEYLKIEKILLPLKDKLKK